jgi:hypothetical protein
MSYRRYNTHHECATTDEDRLVNRKRLHRLKVKELKSKRRLPPKLNKSGLDENAKRIFELETSIMNGWFTYELRGSYAPEFPKGAAVLAKRYQLWEDRHNIEVKREVMRNGKLQMLHYTIENGLDYFFEGIEDQTNRAGTPV